MRDRTSQPTHRLHVDGRSVGRLEVASGRVARARGLLGRAGLDGALLLPSTRSVHTFGMRFPLVLFWLGIDGTLIDISGPVGPNRVVSNRRAAAVVEVASRSSPRAAPNGR